jgi:hypothetical protein
MATAAAAAISLPNILTMTFLPGLFGPIGPVS